MGSSTLRNITLLLSTCVMSLSAAGPEGALQGTVRDASGGVIAGAAVSANRANTSRSWRAVTDAAGQYRIPAMQPGEYAVRIQASGFGALEAPRATIQVDQITRLDAVLQVGQRVEVVQVEAPLPGLDNHSATRKWTVPRPPIAEIPLNGRQFLDLAMLVPGSVPAAAGTQGAGFSVNGMRSQSNVYLLDGMSNVDTQTNQSLNLFRITDAVQEFSVQTSGVQPEHGRGTGAQVNVLTRSGSNQFHASAFEYFRNTHLNAADFFTNKLGGVKSPMNRNQFGATLGGPLRRDRTFFFSSWEAFRQSAPTVATTLTPTAAQRATVTDPVSRKLLAFYPLPNVAGGQLYTANVPNTDNDNTALLRIDHTLSPRDHLSARWTQFWGTGSTPGPTPLSGGNEGPSSQVASMLHARHDFSPNTTGDLRLGFSRYAVSRLPQDAAFDARSLFTAANGAPLPGVPATSGLPSISIAGGFPALGAGMNFPQGRTANTFELIGAIRQTSPFGANRHTWSWGFHLRREDQYRYLDRARRAVINFANFADFARGLVNSATIRTGSTYSAWTRLPASFWWQDTYRPLPNLSITFGARYESFGALTERAQRAANYIPGVGLITAGTNRLIDIDPRATGPAALLQRTSPVALPQAGMYADRNNLAPMFGIVWAPGRSGLWVIRTGARLAYDDLFNNIPLSMGLAPPASLQTTQSANVTQPGRFAWPLAFDQNVPLIANFGRQGPGTPVSGIIALQGVDPRLRTARALLHHFGLQRQLGRIIAELDYHGSQGRQLGIFTDANQPTVIVRDPARRGPVAPNEQVFPDSRFGQIQIAKSIANSAYHAVTVSMRRQSVSGAYLQAWYSLGKSIDTNSSYYGSGNQPGEPGAPIDNRNLRLERGLSAFDARHRLVAAAVLPLPRRWAVLNGWTLSGVATLQSGTPFTVVNGGPDTSGFNQATQGSSPNAQNRPNLIGTGPVRQDNRNPDAALDAARFAPAAAGQPGTSGRNILTGPGLSNINLAAIRRFRLPPEGMHLELRGEFMNVLNHTNFAQPVADLNNASFGRILQTVGSTSANSSTGGSTGGSRLVQIGVRLSF
jgi:hypothetical protein